jgi:hypothetical protein
MLTEKEVYVQNVELAQLGKQILWMVDGGEDTCCAMYQWGMKWMFVNEYSQGPNLTTESARIFAMQFEQEFE